MLQTETGNSSGSSATSTTATAKNGVEIATVHAVQRRSRRRSERSSGRRRHGTAAVSASTPGSVERQLTRAVADVRLAPLSRRRSGAA